MPPQAIEGIMAVLSIGMIGTFILTGIRMRLKHKENLARVSDPDLERLVDAVETLADQVRVLTEDTAELQERLDFTERLLTSQKHGGAPAPSTTPV